MRSISVITKYPFAAPVGARSDLLVFFERGVLLPDLYPRKLETLLASLADRPAGRYDLEEEDQLLCNVDFLIIARVKRDDPDTFVDAARDGGVYTNDLRIVVPSFIPMPLLARMLVEGALHDKLESCELIVRTRNVEKFRADLGRHAFAPPV